MITSLFHRRNIWDRCGNSESISKKRGESSDGSKRYEESRNGEGENSDREPRS